MSNGLDSDQGQHSVGPDYGPNHLQRLSADRMTKVAASKEKVKILNMEPLKQRVYHKSDRLWF